MRNIQSVQKVTGPDTHRTYHSDRTKFSYKTDQELRHMPMQSLHRYLIEITLHLDYLDDRRVHNLNLAYKSTKKEFNYYMAEAQDWQEMYDKCAIWVQDVINQIVKNRS